MKTSSFVDSRHLTYTAENGRPANACREQVERIKAILAVSNSKQVGQVTEHLVDLCHDEDPKVALAAMKMFYSVTFTAMSLCPPDATKASTTPDIEEYGRRFLTKIQKEFEKHKQEGVTVTIDGSPVAPE